MSNPARDDRIFTVTRVVAALVIPFLLLAFLILFFFPHLSAERFSWEIQPSIQAAYMASGYLGGAFLFAAAVFGRRWHTVAGGFPAVTAFTTAMLLVTLLHWSRFDLNHLPFQIWLVLYAVTPFLVPWLWWNNRRSDPRTPEPGSVIVPPALRLGVRFLGVAILLVVAAAMLWPNLLVAAWPWQVTPLLARILAGWGALLGMGSLAISFEPRWSAWKVPVGSIMLWHLLYLAGSLIYRQDFTAGWFNWFNLSVIGMLALVAVLFFSLEARRAAAPAASH